MKRSSQMTPNTLQIRSDRNVRSHSDRHHNNYTSYTSLQAGRRVAEFQVEGESNYDATSVN